MNDHENEARKHDTRSYIIGFTWSVILTLIAFGAVAGGAPRETAVWIIGLTAIAQIVLQLKYFLHLGFNSQTSEDLLLTLFTTLLIAIMVLGTVWILGDLSERMIHMPHANH